jgi:molybdopterin-containing oxidoreductase family membrane subunit
VEAWRFYKKTLKLVVSGGPAYYGWCLFLICIILLGLRYYVVQLDHGLIVTHMRNEVSWGMYIANFTYLVGVAAAAVLLVIPAYVYHFRPIKEIVVLGELWAASSIVMALLFVFVDLGRPDRF